MLLDAMSVKVAGGASRAGADNEMANGGEKSRSSGHPGALRQYVERRRAKTGQDEWHWHAGGEWRRSHARGAEPRTVAGPPSADTAYCPRGRVATGSTRRVGQALASEDMTRLLTVHVRGHDRGPGSGSSHGHGMDTQKRTPERQDDILPVKPVTQRERSREAWSRCRVVVPKREVQHEKKGNSDGAAGGPRGLWSEDNQSRQLAAAAAALETGSEW